MEVEQPQPRIITEPVSVVILTPALPPTLWDKLMGLYETLSIHTFWVSTFLLGLAIINDIKNGMPPL